VRLAPALRAALLAAVLLCSGGAIGSGSPAAAQSPSPGPTASPDSAAGTATPTATPTLAPGAAAAIPVWAYYYIWFDPSSWDRAKSDSPLLGEYSSDESAIMRKHIELAKSAGIDGFLVSWKDTPKLSNRLERLTKIARENDFHLGLVYQGLDFARRPIEVRQMCADLSTFADEYAANPVFRLRGDKPVVILTGTDQYSNADLERCIGPVRDRLTVLASSRSVEEWKRVSSIVEGSAYYWSSVNPEKPWYPRKLKEMGDAVHAAGGLWVAPAAAGFDARLIGGKTVVPRRGDRTLTLELQAALASSPDAIGLISWNEFTENSHVEPSRRYGTTALRTLSAFTGVGAAVPQLDSSAPTEEPAASGFNGVAALLIMGAVLGGVLIWARWRREPAPPVSHGPRPAGLDDHEAAHGHGTERRDDGGGL
jgi:Glycosyl hydrolase family 71